MIEGEPQRLIHGDYFAELDDGPEFVVVDSEEQALWIRVGPVYNDGQVAVQPGIWISYQAKYLAAPLQGPVLLSPETMEEIMAEIVERRLRWGRVPE